MMAAAGTVAAASIAAGVLAMAPAGSSPSVDAAADLAGAAHHPGPVASRHHGSPPTTQSAGQVLAHAAQQVLAAQRTAARRVAAAAAAERAADHRAAAAAADRAAGARAARAAAAPSGTPQQMAMAMLGNYGWSSSQFGCLDELWNRESGWNPYASNPSSGAYGIPQSLPGSKMASAGPDWQTNPATQIRWGLGYIQSTYGSPCGAWAHETADGWY